MSDDPRTVLRRLPRQPGRTGPGHPDRARTGGHVGPRRFLRPLRRGARAAVPRRRRRGERGPRTRAAGGVRGPAVQPHGVGRDVRPAARRRGPPRRVRRAGAPCRRWALAAAAAVVALLARAEHRVGDRVPGATDRGSPAAPLRRGGGDGRPDRARQTRWGRVVTYGGSTPWMIVTLADSSRAGQGHLRGRHRRRRDAQGGHLHGQRRVRRLGRAPPGGAPGRAKGRGGVVQRDGDRHRHVGLRIPSTGTCRACTARRPARRCSRPGPG